MAKKIVITLLLLIVLCIPSMVYASKEDYSFLDEYTKSELKDLKNEIEKRLGEYDISYSNSCSVDGVYVGEPYFQDEYIASYKLTNTNSYPVEGSIRVHYYNNDTLLYTDIIFTPATGLDPLESVTVTSLVQGPKLKGYNRIVCEPSTLREQ